MKRFLAGTIFGLVLAAAVILIWHGVKAQRKPHATSQPINQATEARKARELKRGRDPDQRFVPMHVEKH